MEKVEYHTQEEKEACDFIRWVRAYSKKTHMSKTISIPCEKFEGKKIGAVLVMYVNRNTGNLNISHSLSCGYNLKVSPSTNKKLRCTNKHAIDTLKKVKEFRSRKGVDTIHFSDSVGEGYRVYIEIDIPKIGELRVCSGFKAYSGAVKTIKEKWYDTQSHAPKLTS